jgi:hypothetical protein
MPKAARTPKTAAKTKPLYPAAPWSCVHRGDHSLIEAHVDAAGDWQTVAEIRNSAHIAAEPTADFIARAVNDYESNQTLIAELIDALELCLACDGLSWEAEHDAEIILARAKAA